MFFMPPRHGRDREPKRSHDKYGRCAEVTIPKSAGWKGDCGPNRDKTEQGLDPRQRTI
jgi:hypothetical protein